MATSDQGETENKAEAVKFGEAVSNAEEYGKSLAELSDDALLDSWADLKRSKPPQGERDEHLLKKNYAEQEAIKRFGLKKHLDKLYERHPSLKGD